MEILNIGPLELIVILVLMFIILGPKDMVKTAQRIGAWVRSLTRSQMWREVWGISQDIRELPKKLMEETGLEEALTDVQKTTQEVTNELNSQIREVNEAARVPEVEHLRIETNPLIAPPPDSVPAALPAAGPTSVQSPVNLDAVQPAELKVSDEVAAAAAFSSATVPVEITPAKKTRRKKGAPGGGSLAEPDEPFWPDAPFFTLESGDVPTPGNGKTSAETEPGAQPRPRKRRAAQPAAVENTGTEPALGEPDSSNGAVKPARVRKPRQPKVKTSAPEAGAPEASTVPVENEALATESVAPEAGASETAATETYGAVIYAAPAVETGAAAREASAAEAVATEAGEAEPNMTDAQPETPQASTNGNGNLPQPQPDQDAAQLDRDAA